MAELTLRTGNRSSSSPKTKRKRGEEEGEHATTSAEAKTPRFSVPDFLTMSFDIVNICVGEPATSIPVYKDIICSVAPYFRGAFNHAFREAEERAVSLPDVDESTFRIFLKWCHSQSHPTHSGSNLILDACIEGESQGSIETPLLFDEFRDFWPPYLSSLDHATRNKLYYRNPSWVSQFESTVMSLLKLYIFADKYSIDLLRDDIMSAVVGYCTSWEWWPDPDSVSLINMAYNALPSSSPFLRFLVLPTIYYWTPPDKATDLTRFENLHPRFLLDVVVAQGRMRESPREGETEQTKAIPGEAEDGLANSCIFHEHLVYHKEECRRRLANCTFLFKDLLNACLGG